MKIAFYSTKPYDRIYFEPMSKEYGIELHFIEAPCNEETISLARGCDAVCVFVNDYLDKSRVGMLHEMNIKAILLRSAGFNHVDIKAAAEVAIPVLRVPSYSPEAVAEFAMALLLTVNRYTHRAYTRTRDFNMSIQGFQMKILAFDPYPNPNLDVEYVDLDELFSKADVITLHCPLTKETKHLVQEKTIKLMKQDVYLINTSRGDLIRTEDLIDGLLQKKFAGVGLDVYEEEEGVFYEDCSNEIMADEVLARLTTFPNVLITSHMGFFTKEAMQEIARVTLENAMDIKLGRECKNLVSP